MKIENFRLEFARLCKDALDLDLQGSGSISDFEYVLVLALKLARQHISIAGTSDVEAVVFDVGVRKIAAPHEALGFFLHGLSLAAVLTQLDQYCESLEEGRSKRDFARYLADSRQALKSDWCDRGMYESFRTAR